MAQQIIIGLLFIGALSYLGRLVYQAFYSKKATSTGCAKCAMPTDSTPSAS